MKTLDIFGFDLPSEKKAALGNFLSGKAVSIFAPPNAGKGTLYSWICDNFPNAMTVSTSAVMKNDPEAKIYMDKGQLVPPSISNRIIDDLMQDIKNHLRQGEILLLDGVIRTVKQAEAFESAKINLLRIVFAIDSKHLINRAANRRVCPVCQRSYNRDGFCDDHPMEKLIRRVDDDSQILRERLSIFHNNNSAILDFYSGRNISYYTMFSDGTPAEVQKTFSELCLRIYNI